jgi:hypothetical protein
VDEAGIAQLWLCGMSRIAHIFEERTDKKMIANGNEHISKGGLY